MKSIFDNQLTIYPMHVILGEFDLLKLSLFSDDSLSPCQKLIFSMSHYLKTCSVFSLITPSSRQGLF